MAGKGDKQRPTDYKKYRENYDAIFDAKRKESKPDKLTKPVK